MANTKSGMKRDRQNKVRRIRNKMAKSRLRTATRRYEQAVAAKDGDTAQKELHQVISLLDTYTVKGILHRNTAARKKSRLSARLKSIQ